MPPVTTLTYGPELQKMNARGSRRKIKVTYGTLQSEPDVGNQCLGSPVVTGKLRLVGCGTGRLQGRKAHRQDVPVFIIFARIIVVASNPQNRSRPIHHVVQTPQSLLWNFEHYWTIRVGFRQNCETSGNEMTAAAG